MSHIPVRMPHTVGTVNLTIPRIICPGDALLPLDSEELDIPMSVPIRVMHPLLEDSLALSPAYYKSLASLQLYPSPTVHPQMHLSKDNHDLILLQGKRE